jgi:hypothetical protein
VREDGCSKNKKRKSYRERDFVRLSINDCFDHNQDTSNRGDCKIIILVFVFIGSIVLNEDLPFHFHLSNLVG